MAFLFCGDMSIDSIIATKFSNIKRADVLPQVVRCSYSALDYDLLGRSVSGLIIIFEVLMYDWSSTVYYKC